MTIETKLLCLDIAMCSCSAACFILAFTILKMILNEKRKRKEIVLLKEQVQYLNDKYNELEKKIQ